ncbi:MAG: hypothetical protein LPJ87_10320 [Zoogloeaceae bacterium]|nr:hypothetical protein [Zoogloeaceae bacterium]
MSDKDSTGQDPLEMLRQMWSAAGVPLPGMMAPTLDVDDLDKRIKDLRTVENWLQMNLNMLQATIQGLEVQRSTLNALKAMGEQAAAGNPTGSEAPPNPFAQMWPWNMATPAPAKPDAPAGEPASPGKKR